MSAFGNIEAIRAALWTARGYTATTCLYGFREAMRTKDLDAVTLGHGRIVWRLGSWPGPEADMGTINKAIHHAHKAGRDYAVSESLFTAHCHGFNPAYPDATSTGGELAHDLAAWAYMKSFLALYNVARIKSRACLNMAAPCSFAIRASVA